MKMITFKAMSMASLLLLFSFSQLSAFADNPPITPYWAFGHIVWEDSINTSAGARQLVNGYLEHDIPVDGIIIDSPWSTSYNDFNWDLQRYPDHKKMINEFKKRNVKVILWATACIDSTSKDVPVGFNKLFNKARKKGYTVNGGKTSEWWKGIGQHVDFTNPKAKKWWTKQMNKVFVDGVFGWKADEGARYFGDIVNTSIGEMTNEQFRKYYYDAMYDQAQARSKESIVLARPFSHQGNGTHASIEKLNMGWCGDFGGDWEGLSHQITNIYESAQRGYAATATEIGGFWQAKANAQQFIRYSQFGAMTACMVNGGMNGAFTNHLPWWHSEEAANIYRYFVTLHKELAPYMFSTVVDAHLHGGSLLKNTNTAQESHQIGNDIFVKAITSENSSVSFTLPNDGKWVDFFDGKTYSPEQSLTKTYSLDRYPIFIRKGAIIPLSISTNTTTVHGTSLKGMRTFVIYPDGYSQRTFHLPFDNGTDYWDCTVHVDETARIVWFNAERKGNFCFIIKLPWGERRVFTSSSSAQFSF